MQLLEIAAQPTAYRPFPAMPGTLLHVIAWAPQPGKLVPQEKPKTLTFPIIGWGGVTVFQPLSVGPLATMLADALLAHSAIEYRCALEVGGLVFTYFADENELAGDAHGSVAEWQDFAQIKDPYGGCPKKDWDKAVKALRENGDSPLYEALRARDVTSITIPAPTPKPMTPTPLPAEQPVPGTIPGPGAVTETAEEIAEARRNMAVIRDAGISETAPAEVENEDEDDAGSLV